MNLEDVIISTFRMHGTYATYATTPAGRWFVWMDLSDLSVPEGFARKVIDDNQRQPRRSLDAEWGTTFIDALRKHIVDNQLLLKHKADLLAEEQREQREREELVAKASKQSAAEDLYEAVNGLLSLVRWNNRDGTERPEVTAARAALAKADGVTP